LPAPRFPPKITQVDFNLWERLGPHLGIFRKKTGNYPLTRFKPEHVKGFGKRINQPELRDAVLGVDGHLFHLVQSHGAWGEHFAYPIRGGRNPVMRFFIRESLFFPSGQVRNHSMLS